MIDVLMISAFMLYSGLGAATRISFGVYKVYTNIAIFKIDRRRIVVEVVASMFFGAFFTILLHEMGVFKVTLDVLALIAGFFGADLVDIISKKIGLTKSIQAKVSEQQIESDLNDRQINTLQYLRTHKRITNKGCQELTQAARSTAKKDMAELVRKGKIKRMGSGKGVRYEAA